MALIYEYRGPKCLQGDHNKCTLVAPLWYLNSLWRNQIKYLAVSCTMPPALQAKIKTDLEHGTCVRR